MLSQSAVKVDDEIACAMVPSGMHRFDALVAVAGLATGAMGRDCVESVRGGQEFHCTRRVNLILAKKLARLSL